MAAVSAATTAILLGSISISIWVVTHKPIPFGLSKRLGQLQRRFTVDQIRPQPAARDVLPKEVARWPAVRKPDLEAAALGDDLVLDQVGHLPCPMIPPIREGEKPLGFGPCLHGHAMPVAP